MAFIQTALFAETLEMSTDIHAVIPMAALRASEDGKLPVLYLLHGLGGDHTEWTRLSSVERYAEDRGIALILPRGDRSYYMDMKQGAAYYTYLSEELPAIAKSLFPISDRREDTFIAGLSMGGYGAFKLALRQPERFAAAASLSGSLDIVHRLSEPGVFRNHEEQRMFGSVAELRGSDDDLLALAGKVAASGNQPLLYQCCGTEDFLYEGNRNFLKHGEEVGLRITYEEEPGSHEWGYWDRKIQRVFDWLPVEKNR
ncbi:S-formylglutathione hydrolase FrmB [Fontibacillus phaseoli]|uniref:S-formylglutathione hydrolase FrmB n=1 Tax=Fontibacillus phaseoli TaxID=1416533 RepID=A0A369BDM6_9BACL|nr:alpha/beta hydrolase family protein [Fontibacillus phaseoli]RCX18567.1 S-formylglutathione hydrolase FrmB [Fontibacillus phaseoli]